MQIEAGKFYRTRDGRKVGPMKVWQGFTETATGLPLYDQANVSLDDEDSYWCQNGVNAEPFSEPKPNLDLVAEWQDEPTGPVRTVTRREIVPGVYGRVRVSANSSTGVISGDLCIEIAFSDGHFPGAKAVMDASDLRSVAMVLSQLAEALDDNKDAGK